MEWTIDRKNILRNPIFTKSGIKIINEYNSKYLINIKLHDLKNDEYIDLDYSKINNEKFFYDVIYNPAETNFLKSAKSKYLSLRLKKIKKTIDNKTAQ